MSRSVVILDSIMAAPRAVAQDAIIRFYFTDRWDRYALPDGNIQVSVDPDQDAIKIYGSSQLIIQPTATNVLTVAQMDMYGGEAEILRARRRENELIGKLNEAQDVYRNRRKGGGTEG